MLWSMAARLLFEGQESVAGRRQLLAAHMPATDIDKALRWGVLSPLHRAVYKLTGVTLTPRAALIGACLARPDAFASHQSAAFLWGLDDQPPDVPILSTGRRHRPAADDSLVLHRVRDLGAASVTTWDGVRCTRPLRTLADLAGAVGPAQIDAAIDRGLQIGLVSAAAVEAELGRLRRRGRAGVTNLGRSLRERGLVGGPRPSVLESRFVRLLAKEGMVPLAAEVPPEDAELPWHLDFRMAPRLLVEVDGFAYHSRVADRRLDNRRSNRVQVGGQIVLRFDWYEVTHQGREVVEIIRLGLAEAAAMEEARRR